MDLYLLSTYGMQNRKENFEPRSTEWWVIGIALALIASSISVYRSYNDPNFQECGGIGAWILLAFYAICAAILSGTYILVFMLYYIYYFFAYLPWNVATLPCDLTKD